MAVVYKSLPLARTGVVPTVPDSSSAGYLAPGLSDAFSFDTPGLGFDQGAWDGAAQADDDALDDIFQNLVAGITGLSADLVRPRWQPEPANIPDYDVTWVSLGVVNRDADTFAATVHIPDGSGYDLLLRSEEITALLTFYGPKSEGAAGRLRDGLLVDQNRQLLWQNDMELVECADLARTAEFIKQQWVGRTDLRLRVRRQIRRVYPILNLASAQGNVVTDTGAASTFDTTRRIVGSFLLKPGRRSALL